MKIYDVIILGGGASALMCASHLNKNLKTLIIETNKKTAQKLKISGGGKCNITNTQMSENNFDGDDEFVKNVLKNYSKDDLLEFLSTNKIPPIIRKNRYYFFQKSSDEIISLFTKKTQHIKKMLDTQILGALKKDNIFEVSTSKGIIQGKKLIVATGGKSFKNLGASDIGLKIAKGFGIHTKEFAPALVGLTLQKDQFWMKELSGLSCEVKIKVGNKTVCEDLLFAHRGISGPAVLSASLYWKKGNISIDFLPNTDISKIITKSKKLISSAIPLPKRLSKAILKALNIKDCECKKTDKQTKEQLKLIHNYEFAPAGNFGFDKAEVSRGGVITTDIDSKDMQSKDIKGLYFIGEVLNVTGELGGYNLQWAFSSGFVCAKSL